MSLSSLILWTAFFLFCVALLMILWQELRLKYYLIIWLDVFLIAIEPYLFSPVGLAVISLSLCAAVFGGFLIGFGGGNGF